MVNVRVRVSAKLMVNPMPLRVPCRRLHMRVCVSVLYLALALTPACLFAASFSFLAFFMVALAATASAYKRQAQVATYTVHQPHISVKTRKQKFNNPRYLTITNLFNRY